MRDVVQNLFWHNCNRGGEGEAFDVDCDKLIAFKCRYPTEFNLNSESSILPNKMAPAAASWSDFLQVDPCRAPVGGSSDNLNLDARSNRKDSFP